MAFTKPIDDTVWDVLYEMHTFLDAANAEFEWSRLHDASGNVTELRLGEARMRLDFVLEARLLHTRNLIEFFWMPPSRKDDVYVGLFEDFTTNLPAWDWKPYRERLNKALSHITSDRVATRGQRWPLSEVRYLLGPCEDFARFIIDHPTANQTEANASNAEYIIRLIAALRAKLPSQDLDELNSRYIANSTLGRSKGRYFR